MLGAKTRRVGCGVTRYGANQSIGIVKYIQISSGPKVTIVQMRGVFDSRTYSAARTTSAAHMTIANFSGKRPIRSALTDSTSIRTSGLKLPRAKKSIVAAMTV